MFNYCDMRPEYVAEPGVHRVLTCYSVWWENRATSTTVLLDVHEGVVDMFTRTVGFFFCVFCCYRRGGVVVLQYHSSTRLVDLGSFPGNPKRRLLSWWCRVRRDERGTALTAATLVVRAFSVNQSRSLLFFGVLSSCVSFATRDAEL